MNRERVRIGRHDSLEVLVVCVERSCGDAARLQSLLDRGCDSDDWDHGYETIGALLVGLRRHHDAIGLDAVVTDRDGFADFAIVVVDVERFPELKGRDSAMKLAATQFKFTCYSEPYFSRVVAILK